MSSPVKNRIIRTAIFSVIALIIGGGVAMWQIKTQNSRVIKQTVSRETERIRPIAGLEIGGPFTLVNQDGEKVTEATYQGQYKLIYFGFTYCPAICPTELQKMRQAMKGLPNEISAKIQPIFISVDPERDTPEVMKDYISLFDPNLVGLTGTVPQVSQIKRAYRIFSSKVDDESGTDYAVDHSCLLYTSPSPRDQRGSRMPSSA